MSDDAIEKWVYREHTKVKHEILSKYLSGWIRILGRWYPRICYFDCFAGRGIYEGGEKGSPLIALETASRLKKQFSYLKEIVCTFIEKNPSNFENLKNTIDETIKANPEEYEGIKVRSINNEFANVAKEVIERVGKKLAPSFFFIDPFGFKGVPFQIIKDLLAIRRVEVFITFMVRDVLRFLESSKHRISIEELYGVERVSELLSENYSHLPREQALLKLYRDRLHLDARVSYTLPFKVSADERLQTTYYLIHATNHPKGCELMKEIMYRAGTTGRFGYLGPAEGQLTLMQCDGISELKGFLLSKFKGRTLSFRDIIYESCMDTAFIKSHYREAIRELEGEGKISIKGKGPRGGISDNAL
ncbi:hypothetical protein DRP07_12330, partial [Archaeoglobales archaeon]